MSYVLKKNRKKKKVVASSGRFSVHASFNNTIISVSDENGKVLYWSSSGKEGFKGSKKSTPYAAQVATEKLMQIAIDEVGLKEVSVLVRGPGPGRDACLRALLSSGLRITSIEDDTYHPYNGCRAPKRRRV